MKSGGNAGAQSSSVSYTIDSRTIFNCLRAYAGCRQTGPRIPQCLVRFAICKTACGLSRTFMNGFIGSAATSYLDAGEYLSNLIRELASSYGANQRLQLQLSFVDMALNTEHALSLGLLSNELLSNAFEHAFPGNRTGTISVLLRYAADGNSETGELEIKDDGAVYLGPSTSGETNPWASI